MNLIRLYHGTSKKSGDTIVKKGWNKSKHLFLTDDLKLAEYYAECAMEDLEEDDYVILSTLVNKDDLIADTFAFDEPISIAYKKHVNNDTDWHEQIKSGEIPYPDENDFETSLEYTNSCLYNGNYRNLKFYYEDNVAYHVTPKEKLKSILKKGLIPQIGENSAGINESEEMVFLFPTMEDVDTALSQWLGEIYEDLEENALIIMEIDTKGLPLIDRGTGFELECPRTISPDRIKIIYDESYNFVKNNKKIKRKNKP